LYTLWAHSRDGSSNLAIYYLMRTSKAPSGTKRLGDRACAFLMAV